MSTRRQYRLSGLTVVSHGKEVTAIVSDRNPGKRQARWRKRRNGRKARCFSMSEIELVMLQQEDSVS